MIQIAKTLINLADQIRGNNTISNIITTKDANIIISWYPFISEDSNSLDKQALKRVKNKNITSIDMTYIIRWYNAVPEKLLSKSDQKLMDKLLSLFG